ncbi:hypothetical protein EWM64_g9994 [Hericium alpestre]|uniref:Uncharacterized protein n=1 Tax=Hericium alpestre TaxID=135208 RepID=A0A4Y9ZK46_9AGAM|nr:hypothetical protein EWM64_g9994 [Hericium alpestre]
MSALFTSPAARSAARSAPASVSTFDDASPALSMAHGSPLNVSAIAEQSDCPAHDSHTPLVTSTGPTAMLAALAACISIHGPLDIILTSHVPVLAHPDSRIDATHDIADTSANPEPNTNAREPIKRRATTIDEINEGLLAWICEDATEQGWQDGWDAREMHR